MATGMKVWLGAAIGVCALIVMLALPPTEITRGARAPLPEELRWERATIAVRRAHGILVATRWSDSLSALIVANAIDGLALAHPPSSLVTADGEQEWRNLWTARLASFQPRDPTMRVGIVYQSDTHGTLDRVPLPWFGNRPQTYVGVRDGIPYCFLVHPERYEIGNGALRYARTLDGCAWYAKYGVPGRGIAGWLEAGGFDFAREGRVADVNATLGYPLPAVPLPFGLNRPDERFSVAACLAGSAAACELAVTDPGSLRSRGVALSPVGQSPMSHMSTGTFTSFQVRSAFLLSEWEARYGPDAFARFWKSDRGVSESFEAAFGAPLGPWMLQWTSEEVGRFESGPGMRLATLLWALVTVMVFSAVASATAMRRQV